MTTITDWSRYNVNLADLTNEQVGLLILDISNHVRAGGDIPADVLRVYIDYIRRDRAKSPKGEEAQKKEKAEKRAMKTTKVLSPEEKAKLLNEFLD